MKNLFVLLVAISIPSFVFASPKFTNRIIYDDKSGNRYDSFTQNSSIVSQSISNSNLAGVRTAAQDIAQRMTEAFKSSDKDCSYVISAYLNEKNIENVKVLYQDKSANYFSPNVTAAYRGAVEIKMFSGNCSTDPKLPIAQSSIRQYVETKISPDSNGTFKSYDSCYGMFSDRKIGEGSCSINYGDYIRTFSSSIQANFENAILQQK